MVFFCLLLWLNTFCLYLRKTPTTGSKCSLAQPAAHRSFSFWLIRLFWPTDLLSSLFWQMKQSLSFSSEGYSDVLDKPLLYFPLSGGTSLLKLLFSSRTQSPIHCLNLSANFLLHLYIPRTIALPWKKFTIVIGMKVVTEKNGRHGGLSRSSHSLSFWPVFFVLCVYIWVCACHVCILTEILRHFFGYQTSQRNCFAQKHNIDVSIEPNVQLMFILQN